MALLMLAVFVGKKYKESVKLIYPISYNVFLAKNAIL